MNDTFDTSFAELLRAFNVHADRRSRGAALPELVSSAEALYDARSRTRRASTGAAGRSTPVVATR